ncbi:nuclear factor of activated T-cells 5 isoform X1 [Corvus kubaryi]|uniref:nuclear factor of activated T-cells 5 isoform X1 n=2 Tax=Corvus kubaryi TaxID=68294 RepID=UPI001C059491|nr:nuclear factor of activated T-cells 5 isoform X1 [Corvus kubaryi]XP_041878788.1 nuclear factor of activated T-cells 5 isoform X1 [Corvus kubaryi]XP_041878789.1 nuclear factor of activated T-cells 5 isoform X1 [Corvus kubaryi]
MARSARASVSLITQTGESVYDLLPKELQLPPSRETSIASMSQTSGGEAGSPPPAVVAADASSAPSSSSMGGACSSFTTSSSPTIYSTSVTDSKAMQVESCSAAVGVSTRGVSEQQITSNTAQQHPATPKRHTVLYISPPPEDLLDNSRMSCQDEGCGLESEQSCSMWMEDSPSNFSNMSTSSYNDNTEVPRKSRKRNPKQRPGIKRRDCEESNMDIFDADSAKAPHYVLSQLSTDSKSNSKAGNGASENQKGAGGKKTPMLCGQYPTKSEGKELKIVVQPETQHRARYLTEGSRGSVKDRTQQGFPTVKLEGHNEPVVLQVFVGNDSGRVKPHGFYQACRVTGRNTTPCKEVDIEGTTVIEVGLDPSNNMTLAVDCVGILKLRNADVEARIGIAGSKKKSTRARLVFRVNITRKDGSTLTLQTPSSPILCTQPAGVPEILKKSLHSCSVKGEEEVFLIGKNFLKGTKVIFQENVSDENSWKAEAEIDMELFHQNHLIVKVPPYHDQQITSAVSVGIYVVTNAGRSHDVQPFTYTPEPAGTLNVNVKKEISSPAQHCSFEEAIKAVKATGCNLEKVNILPSALITPLMPSSMIKNEDVAPMEASNVVGSTQQTLENSMSGISTSASHLPSESENQQQIQPKVYNPETLSTIQTQDISQPSSFSAVSTPGQLQNSDALLQQAAQFQTRDSQPREVLQSDGTVVTLSQLADASQQQQPTLSEPAQALQQQISSSIFSSASGVSQLQNTIQQLQAGNFPTNTATGSNRNVDLVQQVLEAQQQLSSVLFSGSDSSEDVQDQLNADIFQQVSQIQNSVNPGIFSSSDTAVHSRPENLLPGRAENVHSQPEGALSNQQQQQQQAMETSAAMVMGMQQNMCQAATQMQSDLFSSTTSGNGALQQSPVYQQASHMMGGLSTSEDMQMQCELFSSSPGVSGSEAAAPAQQPVSNNGPAMFQPSSSAEGEEASGQSKQMQSSVFQTMVQMQHSGESQSQVNLFSSTKTMMSVQASGTQQQGGGLFQQGGEMMSIQSGSFIQQSPHSQAQLFHSQNPIGDTQNISQETQGSLFHSSNSIVHNQTNTNSSDQLQPPMFHSQNAMGVLQSSSVPQDQQSANMFLSQSSMSNPATQEEQMSFFTSPNPISPLQTATNTEQQASFQQQTQISHIQSSMLPQEQPQTQPAQQGLFQSQVSLGSIQSSSIPQNQQGAIFQPQHSIVAIQSSPPAQEQQQQQQQNMMFSNQNAMSTMASQKQNMIFNPNQNPVTNQEQQGQSIFHPQSNMASMNQEQQPMQFQSQTTVSPLQNPGSNQAEAQQPTIFHNSPQIQLVQGSPSSQEQQVTLFISSASMSALQNSMSQPELQQSPMYSSQNSMAGMPGTASPPQQQAPLFHNTAGGAINQLQNSPASSQQTSGIFLFGIQNNCGQLLPPGPAALPEELMAMGQPGQPQGEAQPAVPALLSQQLPETPPLPSAMATNQNMEKIDDLLVSLQNQGNNMAGSF